MVKKKICMIGAYAVGKTSLVQRFVKSIFSEKYLTTIGVKIDKKSLNIDGTKLDLILWDIHGEDDYQKVQSSYLVGSAGYFLVIDGTRKNTLEVAEYLNQMINITVGKIPFYLLINKVDMKDEWEIDDNIIEKIKQKGWKYYFTSAKTGEAVELAFLELSRDILKNQ
ncbi:MAG: GTP-binding protein [Bacteroidetes bacterium]|jgi:small GTP-binding protein|nr:GTP-binding protein [Bacteroidota bacterium]MBT6685785.1 GTP-binding protein [Bacteroidota bacterium]MBT7142355.1 GTP-binding protein [Bacteroidota bacterium]MBT7492035.1 GTP-binding protein [Bacteroidota bacterium]